VLGTARASYRTHRAPDGEVSQWPDDWMAAASSTVRDVMRVAPQVRIAAIGITAPAHVGVLTSADGTARGRSLLAFDRRPDGHAKALAQEFGAALVERTMVHLTAGWNLAQLAWLRDHEPDRLRGIRWYLTQKDWIRFRLTGTALIDPTDAAGTALYDPVRGEWLGELGAAVGLPAESLPPIAPSNTLGGTLSAGGAAMLSLPVGTPIAVGATDTAAELVSVGATEPGSSLVKIASTGTVVAVSGSPVTDRRVLTYPHAIAGRWYTLGATSAAAVSYEWLRELAFSSGNERHGGMHESMGQSASGVAPGAGGVLFLPFLQGERTPYWDPDLRGAFLGLAASHGREHLCRAVMEGVALSLRTCRDVIREIGLCVDEPVFGGGGIASALWATILASTLGQSGRVVEPQGPAVGAAILAANAVGADLETALALNRTETAIAPVAEWVHAYDELYVTYAAAIDAVRPIVHRLANLGR
jgi:xylulokinase